MKRLIQMGLLVLALALPASAQIFGPAASLSSGLSDPLTCTPSGRNAFFNRTSGLFKLCTAVNTWTAVGGSAVPVTYSGATASINLLTLKSTDDLGPGRVLRVLSSGGSEVAYWRPDGAIYLPAGSSGTPALAIGATNTGWYNNGGGWLVGTALGTPTVAFYGGAQFVAGSSIIIGWDSNTIPGAAGADTVLQRDAAGVVAFKATRDNATRIYTANGAYWEHGSVSELLTIAAAATTDTSADLLPADSIIEAVVVRVTTVIPTAATFTVGDATTAARFATGVTVAATTTAVGLTHSDQTGAGGPKQVSAAKVRITPNLTPGAATGVVRITVFYRRFVAPTS
jgi:hypothetical protein